ncbi:MAG TPA: PIN domain-containing protein [Candidatus Nanoarchaeia archaeon]|nr:PIN domain-containing protein [Candidatus Nanoarchaeia archaeon]
MACLDTTFLIDLLRKKPEIVALKDDLDRSEQRLTIAAPAVMELWFGILANNASAREKARVLELFDTLEILPLDRKSAQEAGEIEAALVSSGQQIETEDIMIAAIARVNGEKVVTRDRHYARIPGLQVHKY